MAKQDQKQTSVNQGASDQDANQKQAVQRQIGSRGLGGDTSDDMVGVGPGGPASTHEEQAGHEKAQGDVRRVGRDEDKGSQGFGNE